MASIVSRSAATVFGLNVKDVIDVAGNDRKQFVKDIISGTCLAVANFEGTFDRINYTLKELFKNHRNFQAMENNFLALSEWEEDNQKMKEGDKKEENKLMIQDRWEETGKHVRRFLAQAQTETEEKIKSMIEYATEYAILNMVTDDFNRDKLKENKTKFYEDNKYKPLINPLIQSTQSAQAFIGKVYVKVQFSQPWSKACYDSKSHTILDKSMTFNVSVILCDGAIDYKAFEKKVFSVLQVPDSTSGSALKEMKAPGGGKMSMGDALRNYLINSKYISSKIKSERVGGKVDVVQYNMKKVLGPDVLMKVYENESKRLRSEHKLDEVTIGGNITTKYDKALSEVFDDTLAFDSKFNNWAQGISGGYMVVCESKGKGVKRSIKTYRIQIVPDKGSPREYDILSEAAIYKGMIRGDIDVVEVQMVEDFKNSKAQPSKAQHKASTAQASKTPPSIFDETGLRARLAPRGVIDIETGTVATVKNMENLASPIVIVVDPIMRWRAVDKKNGLWSVLVQGMGEDGKMDQYRRVHPKNLNFVERDLAKKYQSMRKTYVSVNSGRKNEQSILDLAIKNLTDDLLKEKMDNDALMQRAKNYPFFYQASWDDSDVKNPVRDRLIQLMNNVKNAEVQNVKSITVEKVKPKKKLRVAAIHTPKKEKGKVGKGKVGKGKGKAK